MMVPPGGRSPPLTLVHAADDTPTITLEAYIMEESVPGEVGYASPRNLGIQTLLFDVAAMLSYGPSL